MKVAVHSIGRLGAAATLLWAGTALACVVGSGSGTCTESALDACLPSGGGFDGTVTFNCGASPFTLTVTTTKTIAADTSLDGGGLVTLTGGGTVQLFGVNAGVTLSLDNITISGGGNSSGGAPSYGGAIANSGTLNVANTTFSGNSASSDGGALYNDYSGSIAATNSTAAVLLQLPRMADVLFKVLGVVTDGGGCGSHSEKRCDDQPAAFHGFSSAHFLSVLWKMPPPTVPA